MEYLSRGKTSTKSSSISISLVADRLSQVKHLSCAIIIVQLLFQHPTNSEIQKSILLDKYSLYKNYPIIFIFNWNTTILSIRLYDLVYIVVGSLQIGIPGLDCTL